MNKDLAKIEFYFPAQEKRFEDKQALARQIVADMQANDSIKYSGHTDEEKLYRGLIDYLGKASVSRYAPIKPVQKNQIESHIRKILVKCNAHFPIPTKNFIFVFPYLPAAADKIIEGVMGVARYSCVFHLFISLSEFTKKSLANTVAHELNHTIYYFHHYDDFGNYSLLDNFILEGLAENFREHVVGGGIAPWSQALNKKKAFKTLDQLEPLLYSRDEDLQREIFFGNNLYKKWTGYSIGYWLIRHYLDAHPRSTWQTLMLESSDKIFEAYKKGV